MTAFPAILPVELAQQGQQQAVQPFLAYPLPRALTTTSVDRAANAKDAARTRAGQRAAASGETENRPNFDERSNGVSGRRLDIRV